MKLIATGVLVLSMQAWCAGMVNGAEPAPISEERSKQQAIFEARGDKRPEGYVIDRNLLNYADTFHADFSTNLAKLGANGRWLDIGAGRGQAILDYFNPSYKADFLLVQGQPASKGQAVAMSIEDRRTPQWQETLTKLDSSRMRYVFSKPLREYAVEDLGRFQIITDLLGGFSYTDELSMFMEKVLGLLEVKGTFYTVLQDVQSEKGTNPPFYANSPYLTVLTKAGGAPEKVCTWLKSISCAEVSCELKPEWKPPIEVYRIQKTCEAVRVPPLTRTHYQAGTPPERRFVFKN